MRAPTETEKATLVALGTALRAAREELGMTLADVADLTAGVSDMSSLSKIEKGQVNIGIITFLNLCHTLAVSPDLIVRQAVQAAP